MDIGKINLATFDLNLLRVLDALLREGSTVRAGERLGLSQSAVSGALARLRHALGDALFIRQGNRLVPTDRARALEVPIRAHLENLEQLLAAPVDFDPRSATEAFRIAASDFFAELLMPRLAQVLRLAAPGVRVHMVDLVPENYVESLDRYRADLVLLPDDGFPPWLVRQPLFHSSFAAIARTGHPDLRAAGLSPGDVIPIDLFCALGHVLFSPEGHSRAMGDAALARAGRKRQVVMTMPVFSGVCRAVAAGDLIALVPRQLGLHLGGELGITVYRPPMTIAPALIVGGRASGNPFHAWMRRQVFDLLTPLNVGEPALPDELGGCEGGPTPPACPDHGT